MVKLDSMLREMQSWITIPESVIDKAELSGKNTENTPQLKEVVEDWKEGRYDEDIDLLADELQRLV